MRRVPALVGLCGLVLAGLALPAAAQTATVAITNFFPRCVDVGEGSDISISGTTNVSTVNLVLYAPDGTAIGKATAQASNGAWSSSALGLSPEASGTYEVRATAGTTAVSASAFFEVPCRAPLLAYDPPCSTSTTTEVRMTGRWFQQFDRGYFDLDLDGDDAIRLPIDNRGTFSAVITVKPGTTDREGEARDLRQNVARATWRRCPPGATTTTTTTPPRIGSTTTTATTQPRDDPAPDDTTTTQPLRDEVPGVPVTIPPTIDLPPPTPGASLTVAPELGPAGFVTGAVGTGFPPGPVIVTWSPGIGATTAVAGPDGTFSVRMLVLPNDRLGPRAIVALSGATTAYDAFLVVPSSVQPSGQNVQQINRIRRFNQR